MQKSVLWPLFGSADRDMEFGSVTISWRGVWAFASVSLLSRMDLPKVRMKGLTTRVLLGSYLNFVRFNAVTYRARNVRHGRRVE